MLKPCRFHHKCPNLTSTIWTSLKYILLRSFWAKGNTKDLLSWPRRRGIINAKCDNAIYGGPQLSRKIKFRTTNWNYFRQTTNNHGKNKNSRHYSEFLTAKANRSRRKQIAHGKSQSGGQRFLVSVQVRGVTGHDLHDGKTPGRVDRVVLHHVLGRPLTKNRWPPLWLLPWAICFCREEFWIVSTVFVFAVIVCSLPEVISICCSEFYFLVLNFILPWQLWATVAITWIQMTKLAVYFFKTNKNDSRFHRDGKPTDLTSPAWGRRRGRMRSQSRPKLNRSSRRRRPKNVCILSSLITWNDQVLLRLRRRRLFLSISIWNWTPPLRVYLKHVFRAIGVLNRPQQSRISLVKFKFIFYLASSSASSSSLLKQMITFGVLSPCQTEFITCCISCRCWFSAKQTSEHSARLLSCLCLAKFIWSLARQ